MIELSEFEFEILRFYRDREISDREISDREISKDLYFSLMEELSTSKYRRLNKRLHKEGLAFVFHDNKGFKSILTFEGRVALAAYEAKIGGIIDI
uniref:Uncharacterized protein n=1 Tax=viral metagenome TaxID=1070528 RepID=A0A6M3IZI0_9ZZZZ